MDSSTKKTDRVGIVVWSLIAGLFIFAGISKYGVLLGYLKVSGYLAIFLAGYLTYKITNFFDEKIRTLTTRGHSTWRWLQLIKSVLGIVVFAASIYALVIVQPDKLAIAHIKGIPVEALYPCSNQPLSKEVEGIAREIFRLKEIDSFDQGYCSAGE